MYSRELRELEHVPRWAIIRCIRQQSVAEHSYFTAMYAIKIAELIGWDKEFKSEMYKLVKYALWHDIEECFMSDIPGPIKHSIVDENKYELFADKQCTKYWGQNKKDILNTGGKISRNEIMQIVKCASTIEELFYLLGEEQLGNGTIYEVIKASKKKAIKELQNLPFICGCTPDRPREHNCEEKEKSKKAITEYLYEMIGNHTNEQSTLISKLGTEG